MTAKRTGPAFILASTAFALVLAASGCGKSGPKPSDADIAAYLAQGQPNYLRLGHLKADFEPIAALGSSKLPQGSWRVHVQFFLHAQQDLFAPTPAGRAQRSAFDMAVARTEEFRTARIAAVDQLGHQAGLIAPGGTAPEPAMPVSVVTHKDQDLDDRVTLLAQPDGGGWKFFQLDAQSLSDEAIGAPVETLKQESPKTVFVVEGSDEERSFREREGSFLDILAKAPKL